MREYLKNILRKAYGFLTYIIPKKKNYLVFMPVHNKEKFTGNLKALILYASAHHPEVKTSLIATAPKMAEEAENRNLHVVRTKLHQYWSLLRAEHMIIDHTTTIFSYGRFSIIQLWHGAGFKNVSLFNGSWTAAYRKVFRKHTAKYRLFTVTSESDRKKRNESFGIDKSVITGYPRNDVFFDQSVNRQKLRQQYGVNAYDRIITYAPTYKNANSPRPFTASFWERLNASLEESNSLFVVKKHPWDKNLTVPQSYSHIKDLTTEVSDVQELLLITDLLISDYSAILTDYAITGKPILIYAFDLNDYLSHVRTAYYDLEKTLPRPFVKEETELLAKIKDSRWQENPAVKTRYREFQDRFHFYKDGNAGKRVMESILNL